LRTGLTMLGIIIGIFAVTLVLIISQGATSAITSKISSLGTNLLYIISTPAIPLTLDDAKAIAQQIPEVDAVAEEVTSNQTVAANGQSTGAAIEGVSPSYAELLSLTTQQGTFFTEDDITGYSAVAVVGQQIVTDLYGTGANPIGQLIQIGHRSFYIVGE